MRQVYIEDGRVTDNLRGLLARVLCQLLGGHSGASLGMGTGTVHMCHDCLELYELRRDWPTLRDWFRASRSLWWPR